MPKITLTEAADRLKHEVFMLRQAIRCLLPEKVADVLSSYHDCESVHDVLQWDAKVLKLILKFAQPRPAHEMGDYLGWGERAYCPLCKASTQGPYANEGFKFPEGLLMHLRGNGNAPECLIMRAARVEAREHVDEFAQHSRALRRAEKAARARKR